MSRDVPVATRDVVKDRMSDSTRASRAVSRDVPVATRDVVEDRMSGATGARLVEDVEALDALEVVFLVHVVLRH